LADGRFALVDEDLEVDALWFNWCGGGYKAQYAVAHTTMGQNLYLHQLVLPGVPLIDHRNGNKLDCRRENLREATVQQNACNMRRHPGSSVPYKGIRPNGRNWAAWISLSGKNTYLGTFKTAEEAARIYDAAARVAHGAFACVNFPLDGEQGALLQ
jgi:hypothetical protein